MCALDARARRQKRRCQGEGAILVETRSDMPWCQHYTWRAQYLYLRPHRLILIEMKPTILSTKLVLTSWTSAFRLPEKFDAQKSWCLDYKIINFVLESNQPPYRHSASTPTVVFAFHPSAIFILHSVSCLHSGPCITSTALHLTRIRDMYILCSAHFSSSRFVPDHAHSCCIHTHYSP